MSSKRFKKLPEKTRDLQSEEIVKLIPILKILATNPATSPVIPPPKPIIRSDLFKFLDNNIFKKLFTIFIDLFFSLASNGKNERS